MHRGGGRNYTAMKNDILRFLRQEKDRDVFFTTMIDLYALPVDFPGRTEAESLRHVPYERVSKLEQCFAEDVEDRRSVPSRFIPHIQLHEFGKQSCFVIRPHSPRSSEIAESRSTV